MGSIDYATPLQLNLLSNASGFSHVNDSFETIAETIWAITSFVYTGDNEVSFLKFTEKSAKLGVSTCSSQLHFGFTQDSSAASIAKARTEGKVRIGVDVPALPHDSSLPSFTQLIKRVALLVTAGDQRSDIVNSLGDTHKDLVILHVVLQTGQPARASFVDPKGRHTASLINIADTVHTVAGAISNAWLEPLGRLGLLGPENWRIIRSTAPTTAEVPDAALGDILAQQSQQRPDKLAIEAWDGELTYAQLYRHAQRMAVSLMARGLGAEDRVGICMKKSKWSMVALWGILLAGCTGVPLDIRNPLKRTETLLQRVKARHVVADEWTKPSLDGIDVNVLQCSSDLLDTVDTSDARWPMVSPWSVAFVLFTSGSTGLPKGVVIEHGPLFASIAEVAREQYFDHTSKVFQFAPFISDISTGDIFATALAGGTLFVPSEEQRLDSLAETLRASRATHVGLTSSVITQLEPDQVPDLRVLISGGEALSKANLVRWSPRVCLITAYGITESLVWDSFASPHHLAVDYRNIGMARGPCIWVTDLNDPERVMPIGAVGEIIIEGPLLAREYMDAPELTAAKFIPAPTWLRHLRGESHSREGRPKHRCYRSGDCGMRNADGTVLFLGRVDNQVKIRGQRVELNEIEHSLLMCNDRVHEVAIELVRLENRGQDQALIAFIQRPGLADDEEPLLPMDATSESIFLDIHAQMLEAMPHYMVPTMFVPVSRIPKGALGKRDRITLRRWGSTLTAEQLLEYRLRRTSSSNIREASSPEEELLLEAWAKVLRMPLSSLGPHDHFFQVGGDSFKAIQVVAALRAKAHRLTVLDMFRCPELSEQAKMMSRHAGEQDGSSVPQPFELIPCSASRQSCINEAARVSQVSPEDIEDMYPATPMQEGLMAISSHRKNLYSHRVAYRVPDSIDLPRFKAAWEKLVAGEPIFRTRLVTLPGIGTWQVVVKSAIDWHENLTSAEYAEYDQQRSFGYGTELSRYAIVRDATDGTTQFIWSGHHAIADGWSRDLMFKEVAHIYRHESPRPRSPYTPYIKFLAQADSQESAEFWTDQFLDTVAPFPALPSPSYKPEAREVRSLAMELRRPHGSKITASTLVQAAWALVSSAYANAEETIFGLTLSGRDAPVPGVEETMGVTITTVPVQISFDSTSTIAEYLDEVQQYIAQVKQHQNFGMQNIARLSDEARSATMFQSLLVVQPGDDSDEDRPMADLGLELAHKEDRDTLDYALTLQAVINNDSLRVTAHFDDNVIPQGQMECILALLEHTARQLANESTERTLHELDWMSPHDQQLLATYNGKLPAQVKKTLHGMFEDCARDRPDAVALQDSVGSVTYARLNHLAQNLAKHLVKDAALAGSTEPRVILCFAKSTVPIVAILAVLKAGGTCASVNPEHPAARLSDLARDVDAALVLCDESFVGMWEAQEAAPPVLAVSQTLIETLADDPETTLPTVLPSSASFIIYTSGTTGKPKASVLEHQNLATGLSAVGDRLGLDATVRTLQFSAYTFDAHILEIFTTLGRGGCVCVISDHERMNSLARTIHDRRATFALLTKTVARLLEPGDVPTLQTLVLSGEPNGRQDYQRWAPKVRLFNGLGPSECTPLVCLDKQPVSATGDPSNIGHSLGCHVWITNHRRPNLLMPIGCVGELTVEGPIVGRGYVNRPKENSHSFIHEPQWSRREGAVPRRFYRSGDLAKMNHDGSITFIGRADNQVKIHGQRVELGEIEDHLRRQSAAFTSCAVEVLTISSRGGASVLAVFCARGGGALAVDGGNNGNAIVTMDDETRAIFMDTQAKLLGLLPQYMVPTVFVPVIRLPINASGKLERKKLHVWAAELDAVALGNCYLASKSASSAAPATPMEKRLQALWANVLRVPLNAIYTDGHFFRLGGDSVLSMQLIATARADGIAMTVADVFKSPLLRDMALTMTVIAEQGDDVDAKQRQAGLAKPYSTLGLGDDAEALQRCLEDSAQDCEVAVDAIEDMYPCTPAQEALMAVSSHRPKAYTYQIVLRLPATMDLARFKQAWETLVATYAIYRTRIVFRRGLGSLQVALRASGIAWRNISGTTYADYLAADGQLFVEYGGELCKFALLEDSEGDGQTTFVATLHHSLYDGWSMMRTWKEWTRFYTEETDQVQARAQAQAVAPYSDFFRYMATIGRDETRDFWTAQFPEPVMSYPQLPAPDYMPSPKKAVRASVPCDRKQHASGATMATVIQAAWALLLSRYSQDSEDVVFGLMQSGRDAPIDGIADMVGPTIATVPTRVHLAPSLSVQELLDAVQANTAQIRRHQHAGLQHIRLLGPGAHAAVLFQSLLTVHTLSDGDIKSPLAALGIETRNADIKEFLDLALTVECTIRPDRLDVLLNYDNAVVADGEAAFVLRHVAKAIPTLLAADGATKLGDMQLVSANDIKVMQRLQKLAAPRASPASVEQEQAEESEVEGSQSVRGAVERHLQLVWSQVLDLDVASVGLDDAFTSLGGHSITAMQAVSECRRLGIKLKVSTILEKKTIRAVAPFCGLAASFGPAPASAAAAADNVWFDLSPIQKFYFENESSGWTGFNQGFLCRLRKGTSAKDLGGAFDAVVARHPMLRARFRKDDDKKQWKQSTVSPGTPGAYRLGGASIYVSGAADQEQVWSHIRDQVLSRVQESRASIDIVKGPVFSVDLLEMPGEEDDMIYMVAHHLVIDLVSWRIIFRDLAQVLEKGCGSLFVSPSLPFSSWVEMQQRDVESWESSSPIDTAYPLDAPASQFDFWGVRREHNTVEHTIIESFSLSPAMTGLVLGQANQAMRTTPTDILAGLLAYAFKQVFDERDAPAIFIEHHGREPCGEVDEDLAQTVGWFTTLHPVHTSLSASMEPAEAVRLMKDTRRRVPRNGQPYFALQQLAPDVVPFGEHAPAEIIFNFSGGFPQLEASDSLLQDESRVVVGAAGESDPKAHRFAMIQVEVGVARGVMDVSFHLHDQMAHLDRLRRCISLFQTSLQETLPRLSTGASPILTLGDFPQLKHWTFTDLRDLLDRKLPALGLRADDAQIADIYPCTAMQEGILLGSRQALRGAPIYEMHRIWEFANARLVGDAESLPRRLEQAWAAVVRRHSSLRTGIVEHATDDGLFVQVALARIPSSRFIDVAEPIADVSVLHARAEAAQGREEGRGDDDDDDFWTHVPRLCLYRTDAGGFACCLTLSHALMDGTSIDLVVEELASLLAGHTLPDAHADFAQYVGYERQSRSADSLAYWLGYLDQAQPSNMALAKTAQASSYGRVHVRVPGNAAGGIAAFAQREGVTQAAVIQAAWAVVLGVFTGQDDVCFGYVASDRDAPIDGIEATVGLLISMQICRVRGLGGRAQTTVSDIVQGVAADMINGLQHRNSSLALIQSKLGLGATALFDTCITVRGAVDDGHAASSFKSIDGAQKTEYTITLDASIGSSVPEVALSYKEDRVSAKQARSIAGSLEAVLRGLVQPDSHGRLVRELGIVGDEDQSLMGGWHVPSDTNATATVHGLFEEQVQARPTAAATSSFDGEFTYTQLDGMASRLAAHLVSRGLTSEGRVLLCFTKSTWPIVAALAVLKAGGTCVLTDPHAPSSRLGALCRSAGASIVLCDDANASRFRDKARYIVALSKHFLLAELPEPTQEWIRPAVQPGDAAFVVYGDSAVDFKGCVLEHGAVAASLAAVVKATNMTEATRVVQYARQAAIASIFCDTFAPLVTGACVCVLSDRECEADDLADAIDTAGAELIMLPSRAAQNIAPADVPTLRTLVLTDEDEISQKALDVWCSSNIRVLRHWGLAECAGAGCVNTKVTRDTDPAALGQASSGCSVWVVEEGNPRRLVPTDCVGEIVMQGSMLGRGYLSLPDDTEAAFVEDLGWNKSPGRLYRTGRLGRLSHDGSVTLAKVKAKAMCVARQMQVVNGHAQETIEVQHQVPAPTPAAGMPTNPIERGLQTVWAKVLGRPVSRIAVDKTFMSLGGDSLSAMQVVAQCRKAGIELTVSAILQKKTIAAISPHCHFAAGTETGTGTGTGAPLCKATDGVPFALSPIQESYFDQQAATDERGWNQYNQSIFCRLRNSSNGGVPISPARLQQALDAIVKRHGMLRARYARDPSSGQWHQTTLPPVPGLFRFQHHSAEGSLESESAQGVIRAQAEASSASLDIVRGPVFSADLFSNGLDDPTIFLAAHHLVVDIVSWQLIVQDLNDILQGRPTEPVSGVTFQQWCAVQQADADARARRDEDVFPLSVPRGSLDYWGIAPADNRYRDMVEETLVLPAAATGQLLGAAGQAIGASVSEVLVGALVSSFARAFPDRAAPSVFVEHHGREACGPTDEAGVGAGHRTVEPLQVVGWFTAIYPIHVPGVDGYTPTLDVVRRVKDLARAVPSHGRPYFARRYLTAAGAHEYRHHEPIEVMINYSGGAHQQKQRNPGEAEVAAAIDFESRFDNVIADYSPAARRWSMIQVEVDAADARHLRLKVQLNRRMAHYDRARRWVAAYATLLAETARDLADQPPSLTLSDVPLLPVSYEQLTELTTRVLPRLGINPSSDVEDMLPLGGFQRVSIEGHLASPPRHWIQFYFDLPRDVDMERLRHACNRLLQHHSALRSVFVEAPGAGFAQIVLKSAEACFEVHDSILGSDDELEQCMVQLFEEDLASRLPALGKPFVRFIFIQGPRPRLLMRLSHAQFDGYSRLSLIRSLAAFYAHGAPPSPTISFGDYLREARRHQPTAKRYWAALLRGSEPTCMLQTTPTLQKTSGGSYPGVIRLEHNMPSFPPLKGVTPATVFNAAVALLLHSFTQSRDVVFARLSSGRAALPARFQDLVGPCLNLVPVRVRLGAGTEPRDALQAIDQQHVESIAHESLGIDDIIRQCTDWPDVTSCASFPVITQYLNQEEGMTDDGNRFRIHLWDSASTDPFPWSLCLGAFPTSAGVRISIAASTRWTNVEAMEKIMQELLLLLDQLLRLQ